MNKNVWNEIAQWWDKVFQEGDEFNSTLVFPHIESLLGISNEQEILDIACGNGGLSRRLAKKVKHVTAFDSSKNMIDFAKKRSTTLESKISYFVLDAMNAGQLEMLKSKKFDAAICSMALHDIPDIKQLISFLPNVLKPNGVFIFSIPHPIFNSLDSVLVSEQITKDGKLMKNKYIKVNSYLKSRTRKISIKDTQDTPHYYYHRSLTTIFNICIKSNFKLNGFVEASYNNISDPKEHSWKNFNNFPPVLITRWQLA